MNILLIDDDKDCLEELDVLLRRYGYFTSKFSVARNAVEACRDGKFELVITDFRMPGMDGVEVIKAIREFIPNVRIIVISAYIESKDSLFAACNGGCSFFSKPLDVEKLLLSIEQIGQELDQPENK